MRRTAIILALMASVAGPALAQPQPSSAQADPIGALLDRPGQPTPELEEPDLASEPREPVPPPSLLPSTPLPAAPTPYVPPPARPVLTAPVNITDLGVTPDAPPSVNDLAYESRIRSSMASAQGFQGPLDGSWTLSSGGGDLYALQLVDKGRGVVEGAWRDLRRQGAVGASGFVDQIETYGGQITLRFNAGGQGPVAASLRGAGGGAWSGEIDEGGRRQTATLRRRN